MVLTFFSALHNVENNQLIVDKKRIAKNYLSGWFTIDLVSIMPFDKMIKFKNEQ